MSSELAADIAAQVRADRSECPTRPSTRACDDGTRPNANTARKMPMSSRQGTPIGARRGPDRCLVGVVVASHEVMIPLPFDPPTDTRDGRPGTSTPIASRFDSLARSARRRRRRDARRIGTLDEREPASSPPSRCRPPARTPARVNRDRPDPAHPGLEARYLQHLRTTATTNLRPSGRCHLCRAWIPLRVFEARKRAVTISRSVRRLCGSDARGRSQPAGTRS